MASFNTDLCGHGHRHFTHRGLRAMLCVTTNLLRQIELLVHYVSMFDTINTLAEEKSESTAVVLTILLLGT